MQGEALSPVFFSMYINDFENKHIIGFCEPMCLHDITLFLLLYADDTVFFLRQ